MGDNSEPPNQTSDGPVLGHLINQVESDYQLWLELLEIHLVCILYFNLLILLDQTEWFGMGGWDIQLVLLNL